MKRLVQISPSSGKRFIVATYHLEGDHVRIDVTAGMEMFFDPLIVDGVPLSPSDGRRYYDSLERAFSQSSFCFVETVA